MSAQVPAGAFRHMAQVANAQKSTGPVTELGKAAAARNAILHGLTSKMETLDGEPENRSRDLLRELIADIRPADTREWSLTKTIHHSTIGMMRCREHAETAAAKRVADAAEARLQREIIEVEELSKQFDERPKYVMHRLSQHDTGIKFLVNRLGQVGCTRGILDPEHMRILLNFSGVRACDALDDRVGDQIARICYQHGLGLTLPEAPTDEFKNALFEYFEALRGERSEIVFQSRILMLATDLPDAATFTTELEELMERLIAVMGDARDRFEAKRDELAYQDEILAMQDLTKEGALSHRYETAFERSNRNAWRDLRQHRGIKPTEAFVEVQPQFAPSMGTEALAPWEPEQWEEPDDSEAEPEPKAASEPTAAKARNEAGYVCNESADQTITPPHPATPTTIEPPPSESR